MATFKSFCRSAETFVRSSGMAFGMAIPFGFIPGAIIGGIVAGGAGAVIGAVTGVPALLGVMLLHIPVAGLFKKLGEEPKVETTVQSTAPDAQNKAVFPKLTKKFEEAEKQLSANKDAPPPSPPAPPRL